MKQYLAVGSYTEPILFGTGEIFQGKGKGISICRFENGQIELLSEIAVRNPSFLCIDEAKKKIYAVNEMKEYLEKFGGGITQISYDETFEMKEESTYNTGGTDPCHVEVSPNGQFVSVANFASGAVTMYPLDKQGNLTGEMKVFQHEGSSVHPVRQKGPHAHSTIFAPDCDCMFVPDLGIDKLIAYRYDGSYVTFDEDMTISIPAGNGPRFGEFDKDGRNFYLIDEISSQVMHFSYEKGAMKYRHTVNTLPDEYVGDNICSDLHITPNGEYLYASNRGHDSLVCFHINNDGSLAFMHRQSCEGKTPRNFSIDPTGKYLLCGNQDSDTIIVFTIGENGYLQKVSEAKFGSPVCIRFFYLT